jgi:hypothetical protein
MYLAGVKVQQSLVFLQRENGAHVCYALYSICENVEAVCWIPCRCIFSAVCCLLTEAKGPTVRWVRYLAGEKVLSIAYLARFPAVCCELQAIKTQQSALCLTYEKFCSCMLRTWHVTKGAYVCCVPCMWQKVQLSVVYLACGKMCSCLLCTLHVAKCAAVRCVPCMWQNVQLSVVYLDEINGAAVYSGRTKYSVGTKYSAQPNRRQYL